MKSLAGSKNYFLFATESKNRVTNMSEVEMAQPGKIDRVGRDGFLSLDFAQIENRTILTRSRFRSPLQVFQPVELDGGRCAYTSILNPSGGLVGGDRLILDARLGPGSHVLMTTPSATRIYRSLGPSAVQIVRIDVGPEAVLEWMPETLIPYGGSRFEQQFDIQIDSSSRLIFWDAFSAGRVARGERWQFSSLSNAICINVSGGGSVRERYCIEPGKSKPTDRGLGEKWDYFASFYVIGGGKKKAPDLVNSLTSILDRFKGRLLGGVSELSIDGIVIRLAAKSAVDLLEVQNALWKFVRPHLLALPFPDLRKY